MSTATAVIILNVLQRKIPQRLPKKLRTWEFLPFEWMHSLDPLDRLIKRVLNFFKVCCRGKAKTVNEQKHSESESLNHVDSHDTAGSHRMFMDYSRISPKLQESKGTVIPEAVEKKLEATGGWDVESGYGSRSVSELPSRIPTPNNSINSTPSQSVLSSRTPSLLNIEESKL